MDLGSVSREIGLGFGVQVGKILYRSESVKALDRFVSLSMKKQDNLLRVNRCRMLASIEGLELPEKVMRHIKITD